MALPARFAVRGDDFLPANFCRHCDRLISEDWTKYMGDLPFKNIPPFIISLGESDESDSESDSEMLSESEEVSNSSSEILEAE